MSLCTTSEPFGYGKLDSVLSIGKTVPSKSVAYTFKENDTDWLIVIVAKRVFNAISISIHFIGEKIYGVYNFIYAKNPVTGARSFWFVPTWVEQRIGENTYPRTVYNAGGESFNQEIKDIISGNDNEQAAKERLVGQPQQPLKPGVAQRLIKIASEDRPELEFEIKAVCQWKLNAGCLPGGKVIIHEAIIKSMLHEKEDFGIKGLTIEDKVAAVLGHELVHATARHTARGLEKAIAFIALTRIFISNDLADFLTSPYMLSCSRDYEREADKFGMQYLDRAGFKPEAMIWLTKYFLKLHKVKPSSYRPINFGEKVINKILHVFSSTHPTPKERVEASIENYKALMNAKGKTVTYYNKEGEEVTSKNSGNDEAISIIIEHFNRTKESKSPV